MPEASIANDMPVLTCSLHEKGRGNWSADITVQADAALEGAVALAVQGVALTGHTVRGALSGGVWSGRIEGGHGTVRKVLPSRFYFSATARMVLADIAGDSEEVISSEIDPSLLSVSLSRWARPRGPLERAVDDLATKLGVGWRVLRDGSIWIGAEQYQQPEVEYEELSRGRTDAVIIAPLAPLFGPGDLFEGEKIGEVQTTLTSSRLEQSISLLRDEKPRMQAIVERLFDKLIGRRVDLSGSYPAKVISQASDDSLDVLIDDERLRGDGMRRVPIRLGIPGARCRVAAGARVRIHFDNQDQSLPFAALWDTNPADVEVIEIGSGTAFVPRDDLLQTELSRIQQDISTLKTATAAICTTLDSATLVGTGYSMAFGGATSGIPSSPASTSSTTLKVK